MHLIYRRSTQECFRTGHQRDDDRPGDDHWLKQQLKPGGTCGQRRFLEHVGRDVQHLDVKPGSRGKQRGGRNANQRSR